ncbi:MAG: glycosyltransferase [Candidatus Latescibacteria bacterium]|nr:glycosyltransferase [Candidatus Latescibacterota bacterium]
MRYLFTGGGTGGHVYPALAIADAIRRRDPTTEILYIGVRGRIEEQIVPQRGYRFIPVRSHPFPSKKVSVEAVWFLLLIGLGVLKSLVLLLSFRPTVVIGTGGYGSAPVIFGWAVLRWFRVSRAKSFIHEQNAFPGLLNRVVGRIVDRVGVTFAEAMAYFAEGKVERVGYPVRGEIVDTGREEARRCLKIPPEAHVLLVVGGSGGSRAINRGIVDALPCLLKVPDLYILHGTGRYRGPEYDAVKDTEGRLVLRGIDERAIPRYRRSDYFHDIGYAYRASDLVVCRGGAGTLTEVALCGLPSIIIPMSASAGDHQAMNARAREAAGAARVLYEEIGFTGEGVPIRYVDGEKLTQCLLDLLHDPERRRAMSEAALSLADREALDRIVRLIDGLVHTDEHRRRLLAEGRRQRGWWIDSVSRWRGAEGYGYPPLHFQSPFHTLREVERLSTIYGNRIAESPDIAYLRYKADSYLVAEAWQTRNVGVKLVGLLLYRERLPLLLTFLRDRTPAPWIERLFGGDFRQVGFIRRNLCQTIWQLDVYCSDVRDALLNALSDPYYEVRSWAARALGMLAHRIVDDADIERCLIEGLRDPHFEVVVECVTALARVGQHAFVFDALRTCYFHHNWKVRDAMVRAIIQLLKRGIITDQDHVRQDLDRILGTCVDFQAFFPLKQALQELGKLVAGNRK